MDKTIIIFLLAFVLPFSSHAQDWTTIAKEDLGITNYFWGPILGVKAFKVNRQDSDIWWANRDVINNISPNGTLNRHSNATDPTLPSFATNVRFQHIEIFKDEVYFIEQLGGKIYRYENNTQWSLFSSATQPVFLSVDQDSLWICQNGENLQKYINDIPTYYPDGQERIQSKNGIAWSTGTYASDNTDVIRFYQPLTFDYRSADTVDYLLDNYPNDFKFMNNSDTFFLAGNQGFSIAVGAQFIDTLTTNNTVNQPSGKIVEFEFDQNDNIWALFGSSIGSCSHVAFLDRSTNEWTQVFDENNSPIEFPALMSIELDGQGNVYIITPDNLHVFQVGTLPLWLSLAEKELVHFEIYPNPSNGDLKIQIDESIEVSEIQILDLNGRVLESLPYSETITINKKEGVYLVRLLNKEGVIGTRKILIN